MKRLHVQLWIAVFLSVSGMILLFCGFWVVPTGQIDNSVLVAYGEVSTFAGALFGVDYRYINASIRNTFKEKTKQKIRRKRKMNKPTYIIIHCSATREDKDFTEKQINDSHVARGFGKWGYHYYIRKDGRVIPMRAENEIGAHDNFIVPGEKTSYNRCSIGICYEGGLDKNGKAKDTRTDAQKKAMRELVQDICHRHDIIDILGHRDTSPDKNGNGIVEKCEWMKECPCFDVKSEFTSFLPPVIVRP